jgi:hypothetical protein
MWISTSPGSGMPYCPSRRPLKPRLSFMWVNPSFVATSACEGYGVRCLCYVVKFLVFGIEP